MSVDGAAHWSTVHLVQRGCGMYSSVVQFRGERASDLLISTPAGQPAATAPGACWVSRLF
jgi:hypothetical protein